MPTVRTKSHRLSEADYTLPGANFVTFCVQGHVCALGEVVDGRVRLSREGEIVESVWRDLPAHYPNVELGDCVIMPNHVHAVVWIVETAIGSGEEFDLLATGAGLRSGGPDRVAIHRPAPTSVALPFGPHVGAGLLNAEQAGLQPRRPAPGPANTPSNGKILERSSPAHGLPEIIRAWKSFSARRINLFRNTPGSAFWQRSYFDRIIRSDKALERITEYILANSIQWETDRLNPENFPSPVTNIQW